MAIDYERRADKSAHRRKVEQADGARFRHVGNTDRLQGVCDAADHADTDFDGRVVRVAAQVVVLNAVTGAQDERISFFVAQPQRGRVAVESATNATHELVEQIVGIEVDERDVGNGLQRHQARDGVFRVGARALLAR